MLNIKDNDKVFIYPNMYQILIEYAITRSSKIIVSCFDEKQKSKYNKVKKYLDKNNIKYVIDERK
jgi:hypothetical protein